MGKNKNQKGAAFDVPGRYDQNAINGFDESLITKMFDRSDIIESNQVMDAMAGNGNLSLSLYNYFKKFNTEAPSVTAYELSEVQANLAKASLEEYGAKVVQGDIFDLRQKKEVPSAFFDHVMLKSANHEIPLSRQAELYDNLRHSIKPGGKFVNLGMLFEDPLERDESREMGRVKDTVSGMHQAVKNRHFLTRQEFDASLKEAGFSKIQHLDAFDYRINSKILARYYFKTKEAEELYHQQAIRSEVLRERQRIILGEEGESLFKIPGKITLAYRPTWIEENIDSFRTYPMDLLRQVDVHRKLIETAAQFVHTGAQVLDLGCGIGLLPEQLSEKKICYEGIDASPDFIEACHDRFRDRDYFRFYEKDINKMEPMPEAYDHVCMLNLLNLPGVESLKILKKAHSALRKGGTVMVSGPLSRESFSMVEPFILEQLKSIGIGSEHPDVHALSAVNQTLLSEDGQYWTAEGMVNLLMQLGFEEIVTVKTDLYHGYSYFVVARK